MKTIKNIIGIIIFAVLIFNNASAMTFADQSQITPEYQNDIISLVEKNVVSGYPDGSFKPKNKITRAEFCKLIYNFIDIDIDFDNDISTYQEHYSKFNDVEGNSDVYWAKGYIIFCANKNIVAGIGNTNFNPQGNITVAEASKMILTSLGYDLLIEGFIGSKWEENVVAKASEIGLYNDFNGDYSSYATREEVCKLINNAFSTDAYITKNIYEETPSDGIKVDDITKFCQALEGCWVNLDKSDLSLGRYRYLVFKGNTINQVVVPSEWYPAGEIIEIYKKNELDGTYTFNVFFEADTRYGTYIPAYTHEFKIFMNGNQILVGRISPERYTYLCKEEVDIVAQLEEIGK